MSEYTLEQMQEAHKASQESDIVLSFVDENGDPYQPQSTQEYLLDLITDEVESFRTMMSQNRAEDVKEFIFHHLSKMDFLADECARYGFPDTARKLHEMVAVRRAQAEDSLGSVAMTQAPGRMFS